jgi:hypothetical protein
VKTPSRLALLGDLLLIAEKQLEVPTEHLLRTVPLLAGESALASPFIAFEEADPPLTQVEEAAVFGAWIICRQPFPSDNREIGYRFMRLMLGEAEKPWPQTLDAVYAVETMVEALETRIITEAEFVDWVCLRVEVAERLGDARA